MPFRSISVCDHYILSLSFAGDVLSHRHKSDQHNARDTQPEKIIQFRDTRSDERHETVCAAGLLCIHRQDQINKGVYGRLLSFNVTTAFMEVGS